MTKRQLADFRKRLIDEVAALFRSVRGEVRDERVPELFDQAGVRDEADDSLFSQLRDLRLSFAEGEARRAQAIEEALRRISRGEYGRCVDCDIAIAMDRLKLVPWAARCLDCQENWEREARARPPTL